MKLTTVAILVLLFVCPILSQTTAAATCDKTTGFLKWIEGRVGGLVLAAPNTTSPFDICNEVWGNAITFGGSCCDGDKLKGHFESEMAKHKEKWEKFVKSVGKARNAVKKMDRVKPAPLEADQLRKFQENATALAAVGIKPEQAVEAIKDGATLDADIEKFKTEGKLCFEETIKTKAKFFCYGCAYKGNTDFFAPSSITGEIKFNIKTGTCNGLLDKCIKTWSFLTKVKQFVAVTDRVANIAEKKEGAPKPLPGFFGPKGGDEVRGLLKGCNGTTTTTATCTQDNLDSICVAFFSFNKPEKVADAIDDTGSRLLQTATTAPTEEAATISATGIPMNTAVTGPTYSGVSSIAFGDAGSQTAAFSGIAKVGLAALMSVLISLMI